MIELCVHVQGWFNPGQVFVLDEYCARYGVRGCKRHLFYLDELLNNAERGTAVDPSLMHYSFAFCASHVHGHRHLTSPHLTFTSPRHPPYTVEA